MEISDFITQFIKLKDKELEQRVWEIWISIYPNMTKENYISFEEMLNSTKQQEIKQNIPTNGCYIDQVFF